MKKFLTFFALYFISSGLFAANQSPQERLNRSIKAGSIPAINSAIAAGANINHSEDGYTPLRESLYGDNVVGDNVAIARHLLNLGAGVSINVKALDEAPLHVAATFGDPRMVQLLIENGADVFSKSEDENDDGEACGTADKIARFFAEQERIAASKRADFRRCAELIERKQAQILLAFQQIAQRMLERSQMRRRAAEEAAMYALKRSQQR